MKIFYHKIILDIKKCPLQILCTRLFQIFASYYHNPTKLRFLHCWTRFEQNAICAKCNRVTHEAKIKFSLSSNSI